MGADIPEECITFTEGWTGAEIEQVVRKAAELRYLAPMPVLAALQQAITIIVPTTADLGPMIKEPTLAGDRFTRWGWLTQARC